MATHLPSDIPRIHVEDAATVAEDLKHFLLSTASNACTSTSNRAPEFVQATQTVQNADIFKKINALLDNSLDLSSLSGLLQQQQQQEQAKSAAVASLPANLEQLITSTASDLNSNRTHDLYATSPYNNIPLMQSAAVRQPHLQQNHSANVAAAAAALQQSQHAQQASLRQQAYQTSPEFISGAISNRTLEQLTEAMNKPGRAIKADRSLYPGTGNTSPGAVGDARPLTGSPLSTVSSPDSGIYSGSPTSMGTSESLGGLHQILGATRSSSPADSDTSGIGSDYSTDSSLLELMNSLSISGNPYHQQQQQQQIQQQQQLSVLLQQQLQPNVFNQVDLLRAMGVQDPSLLAAAAAQQYSNGIRPDLLSPGNGNIKWNPLSNIFGTDNQNPYSIERAAKMYRNAAAICEATCTWSGQLPPRMYKNPTYSCKVFLGGVPWDITEIGLQNAFKTFGPMKIEWPGKDGKHPRYLPRAGYVYCLFECESSVKTLLQSCCSQSERDFNAPTSGEYYYKISSRRMRSKEVQVIPWVLSDSNFVRQPSQRLDPSKTVFVGALHGMMTAEGLAYILNDLFGNVVYAGIDTDKHKYPIGSGRVTFSSNKSYMKAVNAAFVEVKTPKFTKKIQIDPYLEDSLCSSCNIQQGPFFCRDIQCFRYYCRTCWHWAHAFEGTRHHKPLMRNNKTSPPTTLTTI